MAPVNSPKAARPVPGRVLPGNVLGMVPPLIVVMPVNTTLTNSVSSVVEVKLEISTKPPVGCTGRSTSKTCGPAWFTSRTREMEDVASPAGIVSVPVNTTVCPSRYWLASLVNDTCALSWRPCTAPRFKKIDTMIRPKSKNAE